jgi:hypothetical protein
MGWLAARQPRRAAWGLAGALPFALLTAWHNVNHSGLPWLFAHARHHSGAVYGFHNPVLEGLAALLVSPSRGLLVYSPYLALALAWPLLRLRTRAGRIGLDADESRAPLALLGLLGAAAVLALTAAWVEWHGGWSYGYRIVTEVALLLAPAFACAVEALRDARWGRWVLGVTVGWAVAVHTLHVYSPENGWNATHLGGAGIRGAWSTDLGDCQIAWHLRALRFRLSGQAGAGTPKQPPPASP